MDLSDQERAILPDGALATDGGGNEVLVGLTLEESVFYMQYQRRHNARYYPRATNRDRFLQLHEKYELARLNRRRNQYS